MMSSFKRRIQKMNWLVIFQIIGYALVLEGILMLLPALTAFIYHEMADLLVFLQVMAITLVIGLLLSFLPVTSSSYYARDGMMAVGLVWIAISCFGALPFVISGTIPHFVDAFFETVSGFTTTGATILTDIEAVSKSMLFWRSFTHWIGGMGVLVFVLAFLPKSADRGMFIMRAEAPGPSISKLVPRLRQSAEILYGLYMFLSILEVVFLLAGHMSFYDALIHTFGTAGTGGFSSYAASIAAFDSVYLQMVIAVFMLLFGINFNLYFFLLLKDFTAIFKDEELHLYLGIVLAATLAVGINILSLYGSFAKALQYSFFQVVSVITTTGFATADFNVWPTFSKMVLFFLMVCGSMAGSTGGGVKVIRFLIVFKRIRLAIQKLIHPKKVETVTLNGAIVPRETSAQTVVFFAAWFVIIAVGTLLVALDGYDFESTLSAVYTCIGNVGPGFGLCGPAGSFAPFSALSKITLSVCMLIGRLEIFPILILLVPVVRLVKLPFRPVFKYIRRQTRLEDYQSDEQIC